MKWYYWVISTLVVLASYGYVYENYIYNRVYRDYILRYSHQYYPEFNEKGEVVNSPAERGDFISKMPIVTLVMFLANENLILIVPVLLIVCFIYFLCLIGIQRMKHKLVWILGQLAIYVFVYHAFMGMFVNWD